MTHTVIRTTSSERTVHSGLTLADAYKMWRYNTEGNVDLMTDEEYMALDPEPVTVAWGPKYWNVRYVGEQVA